MLVAPGLAGAAAIDLTRHIGQYSNRADESPLDVESFFGVAGPARLIVSGASGDATVVIQLNAVDVPVPGGVTATTRQEIPVVLAGRNALTVTVDGSPDAAVSVRVKQVADIQLHVLSRVHFNTNVADFAAARAFYGKLGFETLTGFPDTNTQAMARAIGVVTPTSYDGSQEIGRAHV